VRRERGERAAQAAGRRDRQRREVGRAHAPACVRVAERCGERGAVPLHVDEIGTRAAASVALAGALDVAREPDQIGDADAGAEPLRGDVLELVRLVEDDHVVLGQHPDAAVGGDPQAEVGEVQRMVDEDDLGLARERPRTLGEARRLHRAAPAATAIRPDRELRPEARGRRDLQLGSIAGPRAREPRAQPLERRRVIGIDQALLDVARGQPADVVAPPLQHDGVDLPAERRLGERQVVVQQLRLQRARRGRDHHRAPRGRRRDQVGEALAHPGARLAEQRAAVLERLRDGIGHRPLRGSLAETGPREVERTAGCEGVGGEHANER
jgi:hypothetical protein